MTTLENNYYGTSGQTGVSGGSGGSGGYALNIGGPKTGGVAITFLPVCTPSAPASKL